MIIINGKSQICWLCITFFITYLSISMVNGQIPAFGGCPVYQPMPEFDKDRFMGTWYEAERFFTVTELASRCISASYERRLDDQIWVNNFITNRFTGVQRIISGKMRVLSKSGEGKYSIQYTTLPVNYDTTLNVLDTDYTSFAVIWSCNGIGPVGHTQSAWVMTRERLPPGPVLQRAYGVLDKFQISRTFFIKTDQKDCDALPPAQEAYDPTEPSVTTTTLPIAGAPEKKKPTNGNKKGTVKDNNNNNSVDGELLEIKKDYIEKSMNIPVPVEVEIPVAVVIEK